MDDSAAEAAAMQAAAGDGAQIVSTEDATLQANGKFDTFCLLCRYVLCRDHIEVLAWNFFARSKISPSFNACILKSA